MVFCVIRGPRLAQLDLRTAHDIAFVPDGNDHVAQLRVSVIRCLAAGGAQRARVVSVAIRSLAEQRDEALKKGAAFSQDVALRQKRDRTRFIVFDIGSIGVGAITIPINSTPDRS